jgi:Zn-dependent M16 (insulinase) family peptidase
VGFAALALPGAVFPAREHVAEAVLAHQLSTGALWEEIRMKGGAYGAFAYPDGVEKIFSLSTYRDPNPLRSLEAFAGILRRRAGEAVDAASQEDAATQEDAASREDALEKVIIGRYAQDTQPQTAADQGAFDFSRFLYGIDHQQREEKLRTLIGITEADLREAARRLAEAAASSTLPLRPVIIAGAGTAQEAAARLKVEPRELPV